MDIKQILEDVKNNNISTEDAEKLIKRQPFEELGYAKLDSHRELRQGFP